MSLIRWDPFGDADTLFNRLVTPSFARAALPGDGRKLDWSPSADISETDKEYFIRAELPAVKKEDVQVTYDEGIITIKGERKQQKDEKNEKYHRVESFYGSFERSFSLPENAQRRRDPLREQGWHLDGTHPEDGDRQAQSETDHRAVSRLADHPGRQRQWCCRHFGRIDLYAGVIHEVRCRANAPSVGTRGADGAEPTCQRACASTKRAMCSSAA